MSVAEIPSPQPVPEHIAIIMDGNRRWAKQHGLPRALGHAAGARRVRRVVEACSDRGVRFLTLFAFSTENWQRPADEVSGLMGLLALYLQKDVKGMNKKGVRLKVVGDTSAFDARIQGLIRSAQEDTAHNTKITLTIAANYGGRMDVLQAVKSWQATHPGESVEALDEAALGRNGGHADTDHIALPDHRRIGRVRADGRTGTGLVDGMRGGRGAGGVEEGTGDVGSTDGLCASAAGCQIARTAAAGQRGGTGIGTVVDTDAAGRCARAGKTRRSAGTPRPSGRRTAG